MIGSGARDYGFNDQQYRLNQGKLIMEMADLVSARRMEANPFFLAANTALLTVFASLATEKIISRRPIPLATSGWAHRRRSRCTVIQKAPSTKCNCRVCSWAKRRSPLAKWRKVVGRQKRSGER